MSTLKDKAENLASEYVQKIKDSEPGYTNSYYEGLERGFEKGYLYAARQTNNRPTNPQPLPNE